MILKSDFSSEVTTVVSDFLIKHGLSRNSEIAVALSGGADSVCLLYALCELREAMQLTLDAIHVNHGIRGDDAAFDEAFCRELCDRLRVTLTVYHVDVPEYAHQAHLSLESAARKLRYDCFDSFIKTHSNAYIATAHQADDHAETVLFRMARGTGLRGLCGIPAQRGRFIRPCLRLTAEQMRLALDSKGYSYCVDATNFDTSYTRNYVRREIMPLFKNVHEGACENISLMTEGLSEDEEYLVGCARARLTETSAEHRRSVIRDCPRPIAKRMIRLLYEEIKQSEDALTAKQVDSALELVCNGAYHAVMTLPCGVEMHLEGDALRFDAVCDLPILIPHDIVLGFNRFEETGDCMILSEEPITLQKFPGLNIYKLLIQSTICFDTMDVHLFVRGKQDGDSYRFGGMTRKLKKLFNDKNFSKKKRATHPVLCDERGILWVPEFGVREGNDVNTADTKRCLHVCYGSMTEAPID